MVGDDRFIEVFVDTPLEVCEQRDAKGMYALAREGKIKNFTGIDDPYEPPLNAELRLDTVGCSAEDNAERIVIYLVEQRFIQPAGDVSTDYADFADGKAHRQRWVKPVARLLR